MVNTTDTHDVYALSIGGQPVSMGVSIGAFVLVVVIAVACCFSLSYPCETPYYSRNCACSSRNSYWPRNCAGHTCPQSSFMQNIRVERIPREEELDFLVPSAVPASQFGG